MSMTKFRLILVFSIYLMHIHLINGATTNICSELMKEGGNEDELIKSLNTKMHEIKNHTSQYNKILFYFLKFSTSSENI